MIHTIRYKLCKFINLAPENPQEFLHKSAKLFAIMCAGSRGAGDGRGEDGEAGLPGEGQ